MAGEQAATNQDVGAEPTVTARASEQITFSEIENAVNHDESVVKAEPKPRAEKKEAPKPKPKKEAKAHDDDDEPEEETKDDDELEEEDEGEPQAAKPAKKAKILRGKRGDEDVDIATDTVIKVPVAGKKEDVTIQDLVDNFSGKVNYDRKFTELDRERKTFHAERDELHTVANTLAERVAENHEAAFDYLADIVGKDPVELKMQILKDQFKAMMPLYEMAEEERNRFFKDKELQWREAKASSFEAKVKEKEEAGKRSAELSKAQNTFGISADLYDQVRDAAKEQLKRDPTPAEVIEAHRLIMFDTVVDEVAPELKESPNIRSIARDLVDYALRHPEYSRDDMAADIKAVFGQSNERLKNLGRKVAKASQVGETLGSTSKPKPKDSVLFSDI